MSRYRKNLIFWIFIIVGYSLLFIKRKDSNVELEVVESRKDEMSEMVMGAARQMGQPEVESLNPVTEKRRKYVYFDVGARNGDSLANFFKLSEDSIMKYLFFDSANPVHYNSLDSNSATAQWIVYAFESDARYNTVLRNVSDRITMQRHKMFVYYETSDCSSPDRNPEPIAKPEDANHGDETKNTKCKDVAALIQQYDVDDLIVVKVDLPNGAEYDLMVDFVNKDVLKYIDYMLIKFDRTQKHNKNTEVVLTSLFKLFKINLLKLN